MGHRGGGPVRPALLQNEGTAARQPLGVAKAAIPECRASGEGGTTMTDEKTGAAVAAARKFHRKGDEISAAGTMIWSAVTPAAGADDAVAPAAERWPGNDQNGQVRTAAAASAIRQTSRIRRIRRRPTASSA